MNICARRYENNCCTQKSGDYCKLSKSYSCDSQLMEIRDCNQALIEYMPRVEYDRRLKLQLQFEGR